MTSIFIDSGAFIALLRLDDVNHVKAGEKLGKIAKEGWKIVITDFVVDETYTALLTRVSYQAAMKFDEQLIAGHWKTELVTTGRFTKAQEIFRRYNKDKKWSFTDCTSYVVMRELKIKTVFAFDKNFEEMGFKLL